LPRSCRRRDVNLGTPAIWTVLEADSSHDVTGLRSLSGLDAVSFGGDHSFLVEKSALLQGPIAALWQTVAMVRVIK
jgi:hypothetical protein